MFWLIHFIFELIKISILSIVYAILILYIFKAIARHNPKSWFGRIIEKRLIVFFTSMFIISIALFNYLFTYEGNHGLGDSARIPIGCSKEVNNIDGSTTYIRNSKGKELWIGRFTYDEDYLYAETVGGENSLVDGYVVWNLKTDSLTNFNDFPEYARSVDQNNYPSPEKFEEFSEMYSQYWHGWRFWLLP
jgi:hypothetical protein